MYTKNFFFIFEMKYGLHPTRNLEIYRSTVQSFSSEVLITTARCNRYWCVLNLNSSRLFILN